MRLKVQPAFLVTCVTRFVSFLCLVLICLGGRRGEGWINGATHGPVKKKKERQKASYQPGHDSQSRLCWSSARTVPERLIWKRAKIQSHSFLHGPRTFKALHVRQWISTPWLVSAAQCEEITNLDFQIKNVFQQWDIKSSPAVSVLEVP